MPSTSAVYLSMRLRRAQELVEEEVDGVSVDADDDEEAVTVLLDDDEAWVATIEAADASTDAADDVDALTDADVESDSPTVRVEYPTDGPPSARQTATRVRRLLTRRAE